MRMLVTGGTGFIGSHFIPALTRMGWSLTLFDLHPLRRELPPNANLVLGDVRDEDALRYAMQDCNAVLHLAAAHHDWGLSRDTYFTVNESGTRALCRVMDELDVRHLCFFSSTAVYGATGRHTEDEAPDPSHPYGESKAAAERVVRTWAEAEDSRSCLVIRPTVTFGPGNYANMFKLIRQIERRRFLPVGQGANRKSMAYVENLVAATIHLWQPQHRGFRVYNYVDKPDLTSRQIVDAVYGALSRTPPRLRVPLLMALAMALPLDFAARLLRRSFPVSGHGIRKLAEVNSVFDSSAVFATGFEPGVGLPDGIARMVDWYRTIHPNHVEARLPPAEVEPFRVPV